MDDLYKTEKIKAHHPKHCVIIRVRLCYKGEREYLGILLYHVPFHQILLRLLQLFVSIPVFEYGDGGRR